MKYIVSVPELHYSSVEIDAENVDEAIAKVAEGQGKMIDDSLEYSHTLDREFFKVFQVAS